MRRRRDVVSAADAAYGLWAAAGEGSVERCRGFYESHGPLETEFWRVERLQTLPWMTTSPLHHACRKGRLGVVRFFVEERAACVDGTRLARMNSPLWYAVLGSSRDVVEYLVSKGADLDRTLGPLSQGHDQCNSSPLGLALKCSRLQGRWSELDIAMDLLLAGAKAAPGDFEFVDDYGTKRYLHRQHAHLQAWATCLLETRRAFDVFLHGCCPASGAPRLPALVDGHRAQIAAYLGVHPVTVLSNIHSALQNAAVFLQDKTTEPERWLPDFLDDDDDDDADDADDDDAADTDSDDSEHPP